MNLGKVFDHYYKGSTHTPDILFYPEKNVRVTVLRHRPKQGKTYIEGQGIAIDELSILMTHEDYGGEFGVISSL